MGASHNIELSQDAALVAALAGTAMAFSHSAEDQVERWLRALRLHGKVGSALQALGVGEAPLNAERDPSAQPTLAVRPPGRDAVGLVVSHAQKRADGRAARVVCTTDLLLALLDVYGPTMDRALQARGASREELMQRLAEAGSPVQA